LRFLHKNEAACYRSVPLPAASRERCIRITASLRNEDKMSSRNLTWAALTISVTFIVTSTIFAQDHRSSDETGLPQTYTGDFLDHATYLIEVPANWNGTVFLYSHGYVFPGDPNPATDTGDELVRSYLLSRHYALAGSSYASTGWAVQDALRDQIATLNIFDQLVGHPRRTIAWGHSMGGLITAGLVQNHPARFSGAVPLCGVLAGSVGIWNQWLDSAFAFNTLLASGQLQVVNITDPDGNISNAGTVLNDAQATPQGRARIALVAALVDNPGWVEPTLPAPDPTDYATLEANQQISLGGFDFFLYFFLRAELEKRAQGNPSWNTGVDYEKQLKRSVDYAEVKALYEQAGLSLDMDLATLNSATRIAADPAAVRYLSRNIIFDGKIRVPILTVQGAGDDVANVQNEHAYAAVVGEAHNRPFLREAVVNRAAHCFFTSAETIAALKTLLRRLDTAEWRGTDAEDLNDTAAALPQVYDVLFGPGTEIVPPSFIDYKSAPFLRPFDAFSQPFAAH
jgi:pimeloyl-ACP methyl ester carboxylesterase